MFPPADDELMRLPAVCPITHAGGENTVLCSDHASRRHDTEQLYVNAQKSFCTEDAAGVLRFLEDILLRFLLKNSISG